MLIWRVKNGDFGIKEDFLGYLMQLFNFLPPDFNYKRIPMFLSGNDLVLLLRYGKIPNNYPKCKGA